ncbi:MAG: hypothetical protein M1120_02755 [Patescibacteria group bacterium]|nr:hypothetical protein [Patescibacteria group bacterium]
MSGKKENKQEPTLEEVVEMNAQLVYDLQGMTREQLDAELAKFADRRTGKVTDKPAKSAFFERLEKQRPDEPGTRAVANMIVIRQIILGKKH